MYAFTYVKVFTEPCLWKWDLFAYPINKAGFILSECIDIIRDAGSALKAYEQHIMLPVHVNTVFIPAEYYQYDL